MTATPAILWGSLGPDSHSPDPALPTQSLVHLAQPWATAAGYQPFPAAMLQPVWDKNQIVLLDWISWNLSNRADATYALTTIVAGQHDAYLHQWAKAAAAAKRSFLVRFNPEFNLPGSIYGDRPALLTSAWKYVVNLFRADDATNVSWHWCPNVCAPAGSGAKQSTAPELLQQYYPGDAYVDWTGFDCYNARQPGNPWMTFSQLMDGFAGWLGPTYATIAAIAPTKPMLLGEIACWDDARKPAWILDMLATIASGKYPLLRGFSWFDWNGGTSSAWPLTGDALAAFQLGVSSPVYLPAGVWTPPDSQPLPAPPYAAQTLPIGYADLLATAGTMHTADTASILALINELSAAQAAAGQVAQQLEAAQATIASVAANIRGLIAAGTP